MIGQGAAFAWWDMAVEIANRRASLTGLRHRVTWDPCCGVWRVTLTYPSGRKARR